MGAEGLDFRVVPIAFTQGQDTKTQAKLVIPGKWQELVNLSLSEDGTPQRRDGSRVIVAGVTGNGLARNKDQLLTIDGGTVKSLSLAGTDAVNTVAGRAGYVKMEKESVFNSGNTQQAMDCATSGELTCYVWRDILANNTPTGVSVMLVDETTGAHLIPATSMKTSITAFCPRVVYASGAFFIFYMQGTSLFARTILTTAPTVLNAEVALITSASLPTSTSFDVCQFGLTSTVMVSYPWGDGVTSIRTIRVNQALGVPAIGLGPTNLITNAQLPFGNIRGIACAAYSDGTHAGTFVLGSGATAMAGMAGVVIGTNWTVTTAATQIDPTTGATAGACHITACAYDTGVNPGMFVAWDQESEWGANSLNPLETTVLSTALGVAVGPSFSTFSATFGAGVTLRGPQGPFIAGKAFVNSGTAYLPVFVGSTWSSLSSAASNPRTANTQGTLFLLEYGGIALATLVPVAKALYGVYGFGNANSTPFVGTPCSVMSPASGEFALLCGELALLTISGGLNVSLTGASRINMTPNISKPLQSTEMGGVTYLAGGNLVSFDGTSVVEHGFPLFPEGVACTGGGAGTGSMTDGVHQVVAVYEWTDAAGRRHQSSPCLAVSVTVNSGGANTGSIAVQVPTLLLSQKTGVVIACYVTTVGGTVFYRSLISGSSFGTVANSTAVTNVTVTITSSDAILAGNETLYTQPDQGGSTLPNDAPPPCKALCASQNRLWLLPSDNALEYRFSQALLNGFGLQFSGLYGDTTLGGLVPSDSGGTVAIAPLDEKTIIFCDRKLYVVFGGLPDSSGANNTLSGPEEIPSPVGCSDALSVVRIPNGLMFKSSTGWYLLERDLSVAYIGDGVSAYDAYVVHSATVMGDRQEIRFEVLPSSTSATGVTLVYSYLSELRRVGDEGGQWSVFKRGSNLASPVAAKDALWYPPLAQYVWLCPSTATPAGGLFADVPGALSDFANTASESVIPTRGVTAWLRPATLNGFQRVRRLYLSGTGVSSNTSLVIAVDYDDVPGQMAPGAYSVTVNIDSTTVGLVVNGIIDIRHKLHRQKCKSVQFTFTDTPSAPDATPMSGIQTMALEIGFRRGVWKLSPAQTF